MKPLPPQLQLAFALALLAGLVVLTQTVSSPVKFETIKGIVDGQGGGRVIGIARNNTSHLIVQPVLEVTYVTREHPTTPLNERLVLGYYAESGQSWAFYSDRFLGPALPGQKRGDLASERILEIKSWKIVSGAGVPSFEWNLWTTGRERINPQNVKLNFTPGLAGALSRIEVQGSLSASVAAHYEKISLAIACYDASHQLVEAFDTEVAHPPGTCISTFPQPFTARFATSLKAAPASVKVQVQFFVPCTTRH